VHPDQSRRGPDALIRQLESVRPLGISVRLERARRYKLAATDRFDAMVDALVRAVEGLERDGAWLLVTAAVTNGAYLSQLSRPTGSLRQLYTSRRC
jgi:hypothetical protein